MKDIPLSHLLYKDFDIRNILVEEWYYIDDRTNDYLAKGRTQTLLHLITSGQRRYRFRDRQFTLSAGTVLLIPDSTRYYTEPVLSAEDACHGIGIVFDLLDTANEKIMLTPDIYHNWSDSSDQYARIFNSLYEYYQNPDFSILRTKALMYRLLSNLLSHIPDTSPVYHMIEPALDYIAAHYSENVPIAVYAEQCGLSESHFRKKFTECTGMSPIKYRNMIRFNAARRLYQENRSIEEIAEIVGFCDASYFSKLYKQYNGVSLKKDSQIV